MPRSTIALTRTPTIDDELERVRHRVSQRAYELSRTGALSNSAEENWLTAEREVLWQPAVEVCQKDGRFEVRAAIAGADPKDLAITVTPDDLLIEGSDGHEHGADRGIVHLCEFSRGQLFRSIHLPESIDPQKAAATYENGLLTITAPIARSGASTQAVKRRGKR